MLFCCFDEASQLYALNASAQLRNAGISCEIYPDVKKLGKQLDYANALAIPFAAIAGDTEREAQKFQLKDLVSGDQQLMTIEEIIARLSETKAR